MRKLVLSLLTGMAFLSAFADGDNASITSTPSPAVSNKPLEITVSTSDFASEVYLYTWCEDISGRSLSPFGWGDVNVPRFRMEGSGGTYSFRIPDIAAFYSLSDDELAGLRKLGFIAKTAQGRQTCDLFLEVIQGRRDVYSGGEGTAESPFILKTSDDLRELASTSSDWAADCHIRLEGDIDASGMTSPIGSSSFPFKGVFDGNGHTVRNLDLSGDSTDSPTGLFGVIDGGKVKDLAVASAHVTGGAFTGVLAGRLLSGSIDRCYTTGSVYASSICAGGLVGENVAGQISDCYSGASVNNSDDYATGGLVGKNSGVVSSSYAAGAVSGYDYAGGLTGANYGTVKKCVALNSSITATHNFVARFGGNNNPRNISDSNFSWREMTSGNEVWSSFGDHGEHRTASDLRDEATFKRLSGWDFENIWQWRKEGHKSYPVLAAMPDQKCVIADAYFDVESGIVMSYGNNADIAVGPNPASDYVCVSCPAGLETVSLHSLGGALLHMESGIGEEEFELDVTDLPAGLYILCVTTADARANTLKIIKK